MLDHQQIRKQRMDLVVSQAALARATGINRTILSAFETGQLTLKGDCARRLEDFFASRGISVTIQLPRPDPSLIEELRWIEGRISEIERADCDKGFAGLFMETGEREREELFVLLCRWRVLKNALQEKDRTNTAVPKKPVSQSDFLAHEYLKLRRKLAKKAR